MWGMILLSFICRYPRLPAQFTNKAVLYTLNGLETPTVGKHLAKYVSISVCLCWTLNSNPLVDMIVFMTVHSVWYWGFVLSFKTRKWDSSRFFCLFKGLLKLSVNFRVDFSFSTKKTEAIGILIESHWICRLLWRTLLF